MRSISLLLMTATLAACSTAPDQLVRGERAEAQLQGLLAGKSAGQPLTCLSRHRADDMVVIDDKTVIFKDGRTSYRSDFQGFGCSRLGSGTALVTRNFGSAGLCRGDIAELYDTASGHVVGSCVFGDFTPYRMAGR